MHLYVVGTVSSINNTVGEAPDTQIKLPRSTHMTFTEKTNGEQDRIQLGLCPFL